MSEINYSDHATKNKYESLFDLYIRKPEPSSCQVHYVCTTYELWYHNECLGKFTNCYLTKNPGENDEVRYLSWDNLEKQWISNFGFYWSRRKKGYVVGEYDSLWRIKQWRNPDLDMAIKIHTKVIDAPSINEIIKHRPVNLAIEYLVERGLAVVVNRS